MHQQHQQGPLSGKDEWNERYSGDGDTNIWSGEPNGPLVAEVSDMEPKKAVDLGCGEGADAIWLATRGWDVTGIDISSVALERATIAATEAEVQVDWICADFVDEPPPPGAFDLVTTHYPALLKADATTSIAALTAAVAPEGTLLFVAHANVDAEHARSHGFDPDDYLDVDDIAAHLDSGWTIETHETRPRASAQSEQSPHSEDAVLRARRTG